MVIKLILVFVTVFLFGCTDDNKLIVETVNTNILNTDTESKVDAGEEDNSQLIIETYATEIAYVWRKIFDDLGVSKGDKRRAKFDEYSLMLARNVYLFQDLNTDLGLIDYRLPYNQYNHILLAILIYQESSINPNVSGRSHNEVGFMQLHGAALQGHSKAEVRSDPELGLFLGIRWVARAAKVCGFNYPDYNRWNINSWNGALAVYNAGDTKAMKRGRCQTNWRYSKRIVNKTKYFIGKLLAER
jgi:hypothetical protein